MSDLTDQERLENIRKAIKIEENICHNKVKNFPSESSIHKCAQARLTTLSRIKKELEN